MEIDLCKLYLGPKRPPGRAARTQQLALGRVLSFTVDGAGSRSQDTADLRRFFVEGGWHNHPIELKDFHEWIENPFSMG